MLKILLKKQLAEVFKSYFFDAKKNRMRSKASIVLWFVFFAAVMVGVLGGMFTMLALSLCGTMTEIGMGWLYFLLMGGAAVLLGAFGSVFNTYAGLYLAKDNDLLLSMPIPVRDVVAARLINVYLMGTMYAATALLPTLIVYWVTAGVTAARVLGGVAFFLIVSVVVLLLSTVLGWVVAKISLKVKNRSFITVLLSLVFIGAYYFFYFRANDLIRDILLNAAAYGEKIRGAAYGLYLFGRVGEGDGTAAAIFLVGAAVCLAAVWTVLLRSFLGIATASGRTEKVRYVEKTAQQRGTFGALLAKELAHFTASPNYMLNCGLGILFILAGGVLLLISGRELVTAVDSAFAARPGGAAVLLCAILCMLSAMIDTAAPSVSLEGKSIWIPQSLPVEPKLALRAKLYMQLLLSGVPMLLAAVCAAVVLDASPVVRVLVCVVPLAYAAFFAAFCTAIGVRMPVLNWTSELVPIKQSGAVMIALFGGWLFCAALGGVYFLVGYRLGAAVYLLLCAVLFAAAALLLLRWLDTRGSRRFAELP